MSPEPILKVLPKAEYDALALSRTESAYEKLGIIPGAFTENGIIYTSRDVALGAKEGTETCLRLLAHEYGHVMGWPNHDHPTDFLAGFQHAWEVGFDIRAYTRFLRWRRGDVVRWEAAMRWLNKVVQ